jgi:magnesium transporter
VVARKSWQSPIHIDLGRRSRRPRYPEPGSPPGRLPTEAAEQPARLFVTAYGPDGVEEREVAGLDEFSALRSQWPVVWLNCDRTDDGAVMAALKDQLGLHPLALEDVASGHQRSKVEEFDDNLFVVLRGPAPSWHDGADILTEQYSLFIGDGWLISFLPPESLPVRAVNRRIRDGGPRLRRSGADYLGYALIDTIIDSYFPVLEELGDRLVAFEERIVHGSRRVRPGEIYAIKRRLTELGAVIGPLRTVITFLAHEELDQVTAATAPFLRDGLDHALRLQEEIDRHRELCTSLMDLDLALAGQRLNEVMKVLTIIATIFIPLSFVAGLYGMNFDPEASRWNMPELNWRYGYPFALGVMLLIVVALLFFFRHKGWLGGGGDGVDERHGDVHSSDREHERSGDRRHPG